MFKKIRKNINFQNGIFLIILSDYFYNCLFQYCSFNNKTTYFVSFLYDVSPIYILTSFILIWTIWYGPILISCYIFALMYEKRCEVQKKTGLICLSLPLRFYVQCSMVLFASVFVLTAIDFVIFFGPSIKIWPDFVFYSQNVYHIVDVFLLPYALMSFKKCQHLFLRSEPVNGHSVYFCVVLLLLPAILFSLPFIWTEPTIAYYISRLTYLNEIMPAKWVQ